MALGFVVVTMWMNRLIAPFHPGRAKLETYECGEEVFTDARINFNIRYYIFALTFFVFDVEAIFMYPWAVNFRVLPLFALVEMFIFLTILALGLAYAWRKKVLQWV
ncbi:MAG: NADH-quinone oxidoreductase subunit A [Symbiobacteriia bacterium]